MNEANTMADILGRNESVDEASKRLGLVAPRVTPADLEANIAHEIYIPAADAVRALGECHEPGMPGYGQAIAVPEALRLLTICILVTRNGFTVIGHSAPASPENYREELGRRYAKENAVRQLWPLMGYNLRQMLHECEANVAAAEQARSSDDGMRSYEPTPEPQPTPDPVPEPMSDAEHGRLGHVWNAEDGVWIAPGVVSARTQE